MNKGVEPDLLRNQKRGRRRWYLRWWGILGILTGVSIFLFLVFFGFEVYSYVRKIQRGEVPFTPIVQLDSSLEKGMTRVAVGVDDDPWAGSPDATVTIVAFEDFECPFCRKSFPTVRELLTIEGKEIYFVYRDFPISSIHPHAQKAAEAAECADDQGKFWEMHDKIYQNQERMTVQNLLSHAQAVGLDTKTFSLCLESEKYKEEVQKDFRDGVAAGVRGTPTWFINGRKLEGSIPLETFREVIELSRKERG